MFHFLRLFHNKSPLSLSHLKLTVKHWGDSVRRPESWTLLFVSGFLQTWVQYRSAGVCYGSASAVTRHRGAGPAWPCSGAGPSPVRLGSSQDGRKVLVENSICSSKSSKVKRWETRRNSDIKLRFTVCLSQRLRAAETTDGLSYTSSVSLCSCLADSTSSRCWLSC